MSELPEFISTADLARAIEVVKQCWYNAPLDQELCDALAITENELRRRLGQRQATCPAGNIHP